MRARIVAVLAASTVLVGGLAGKAVGEEPATSMVLAPGGRVLSPAECTELGGAFEIITGRGPICDVFGTEPGRTVGPGRVTRITT